MCTYPGRNSARELGAVVHDPFHSFPQCPTPFPGWNAVVEPGRAPRLGSVQVSGGSHKKWQTGEERGREGEGGEGGGAGEGTRI